MSAVNNKKKLYEQSESGDIKIGRTVPVKIKKEDGKFCIYRVNQPSGEEVKTLNRSFDSKEEAERAAKLRGFTLVNDNNKIQEYDIDKQPIKLKTTKQKVEYVTEIIRKVLRESTSLISTLKDVDLYGWETVQKLAAAEGYNLVSYSPKSTPTAGSPTVDVEKVKFNPNVKVLEVKLDKAGNILVKTDVAVLKFWSGNYGGTKLKENKVSKKKLHEVEVTDPKLASKLDEFAELERKYTQVKAQMDAIMEELGFSDIEKRYKAMAKDDPDLWAFFMEIKQTGDNIVRTRTNVIEIKRHASETETVSYQQAFTKALSKVNEATRKVLEAELESTKTISKRIGAYSAQSNELKIVKESLFGKIKQWFKGIAKSLASKFKRGNDDVARALKELETVTRSIK